MRRLSSIGAVAVAFGLVLAARERVGAADDKDWGTIKGRIVWGGDKAPERKAIDVDKDKEHCLAKGPILGEEWIVHKDNKGIRNVVVWLTPDQGKQLSIHPALKEIKDKEVVMDQPCCMFVPRIVLLREGQDLVVKNSAPVSHNINWTPFIGSGGNVLVATGGSKTITLPAQRQPVPIKCDIHPWMKGYIRVFNHPYFVVTDDAGAFEIKNAPAGEVSLIIWHESGFLDGAKGAAGQKVTIKPGVTDLGNLTWK